LINYLTHRIVRCVEQNKLTAEVESVAIAYELYSLYLGHAITQHTVPINASDMLFKKSVARLLKHYQVSSKF